MHDRLINTLTKMANSIKADAKYLTYNPEKESWNVVTVLMHGEIYERISQPDNIFAIKSQVREFVLANAPKIAC